MRSSTTTTLVEPVANRRQPVRQTRINPSRAVNAPRANAPIDDPPKNAPGFFPGITHFTDTITALPKEMIRHYTMLKEVDVKIFGPEETLLKLIDTISAQSSPDDGAADWARRQHFQHARYAMAEMLGSLDEKNHALAMATDALERLLARCDSAWPQVQRELSEDTRYGRLDHWAYTDRAADSKKGGAVIGERTRREVALANSIAAAAAAGGVGETAEAGPSRADTRGKSRKAQAQALAESEQDDPARHGKRAAGNNKRSKPTESPAATHLAAVNGTVTTANKRRKVEKTVSTTAAGGLPMEKSLSAVFGTNTRSGASPRETPALEGTTRKKGRGGQGTTTAAGRRRFVSFTFRHSNAN